MKRLVAILVSAVCLSACGGGSNTLSPIEVTQSYVSAIALGNDAGACLLLEARTRAALPAATKTRITCARLLARCIPNRSNTTSADQSQLLYVNVDLHQTGNRASAGLSGLPIARGLREVTLVNASGRWRLTSPGQSVTRCVARLRGERRRARPR